MIVCHNPPFVFISTPKCGTHSMYRFLSDRFEESIALIYGDFHRKTAPSAYLKPGYTIFTVVRNPFSRCVSAWWACRNGRHRDVWRRAVPEDDFPAFVRWITTNKRHMPPCVMYQPATYIHRNTRATVFLHLEHINEELAALPFIDGPVDVPKLDWAYKPISTSPYGDWREHHTDETIELCRLYYAEDFQRFAYPLTP